MLYEVITRAKRGAAAGHRAGAELPRRAALRRCRDGEDALITLKLFRLYEQKLSERGTILQENAAVEVPFISRNNFV